MSSNSRPSPDPDRLAAARGAVRGYFDRKRRWSRALFVIAGLTEVGFFGAMLFFFDFSERLYWFLFFGFCFVYSPLIAFIFRNSVLIDRMYYRLVLELKFGGGSEGGGEEEGGESHGGEKSGELLEARSFLEKRNQWAKVLFITSALFEAGFGLAMLYFMDFSSQLHWFLLLGFFGVYSPLILSAWRNTFAIDRVYYGLVDELKYRGR